MNILPKKSWHVRNRDNIARVRKDEAEAAEKEKEIEARKRLAEQEAKIEFMRKRTQEKYGVLATKVEPVPEPVTSSKLEHVNFFKDLEEGAVVSNAKNKDHEQEMKEEKEKYEKQIGYLTYLGQDTNEASGKVSWYERPRSDLICNDDEDVEKDIKKKSILDPIFKYKHFFDQHRFTSKSQFADMGELSSKKSKNKKKRKKATKHRSYHKNEKSSFSRSSSSDGDQKIKEQRLQILREKRLKRETGERIRAEKLLAKMRGEVVEEPVKEPPIFIQKYNTQFNPHLAKQNVTK